MTILRTSPLLLLIAFAFGAACRPAPGSREPTHDPSTPWRLVGRFDASDPARPRFSWSGSRIDVRFRGSGIVLRLRVGLPDMSPEDAADLAKVEKLRQTVTTYAVTIDGKVGAIDVSPASDRYEVASNLDPNTTHEVVIVREAEAFAGIHQLLGWEVIDGRLLPPAIGRRRRIEILGDSIACGYGVLGKDADCKFSFATERASHAFGAVAGRALDADVTTLCWSGRGVYRNYDAGDEPRMPSLFERTIPQEAVAWPFADSPQPEIVVSAIGTNDFLADHDSNDVPDPVDVVAFEDAYGRFLQRLRQLRPASSIIVTTSPMLSGSVAAQFHRTLQRIVTNRADPRLELLELEEQGSRVGCDSHPNRAMQDLLGRQLERRIRQTFP